MATHDYIIDNQSQTAFRQDLNNCLQAIVSRNSSNIPPSTPYAYQQYIDSSTNRLYERNNTNSQWVHVNSFVEASLNSTQTISTTSPTPIIFNNVAEDTDSQYSNSTGIFTCSQPGRYLVNFIISISGTSIITTSYVDFYKNGVPILRPDVSMTPANAACYLNGSFYVRLAAGNTFGLRLVTWAGAQIIGLDVGNKLQIHRVSN